MALRQGLFNEYVREDDNTVIFLLGIQLRKLTIGVQISHEDTLHLAEQKRS